MAEVSSGQRAHHLEGEVFHGHYLLQKMVAKGGMAWLFKARHLRLNEPVAVKVLYPQLSEEEEVRSRFRAEARIQFRLKHANIVQVLDLIDDDNHYGMVMEWIEGQDLARMLKKQKDFLSQEHIASVFYPILSALQFAHEHGIVHRDVKPQNILLHTLDGKNIPKLCDFGIAKFEETLSGHRTQTGSVMGTPSYMSPEQVSGAEKVDHRADIYSLGILLYKLTTGHVPFKGTPHQITLKHLQEEPTPPSRLVPGFDPRLEQVILRCIEKQPDARYSSCIELGEALALALPQTLAGRLQTASDTHSTALLGKATQRVYTDLVDEAEQTTPFPHLATGGSLETRATEPSPRLISSIQNSPVFHEPDATSRGLSIMQSLLVIAILLCVGIGFGWWLGMSKLGSMPTVKPRNNARVTIERPSPPRESGVALKPRRSAIPVIEDGRRACYAGPANTRGVGLCRAGSQECSGGKCGPCRGQVLPRKEHCNGADDDCDGKVDESFPLKGKRCRSSFGTCRSAGKWRCDSRRKRRYCAGLAPVSTPGMRQIRLRAVPKNRSFLIQYLGKKVRLRGSTCIEARDRATIRVIGSGFQTCSFSLPRGKTRLRLAMNPNSNLMKPSPDHCLMKP